MCILGKKATFFNLWELLPVCQKMSRYASKDNLYKSRFITNVGKQTLTAMATDIWRELPLNIKQTQNQKSYNSAVRRHLLTKQFGSWTFELFRFIFCFMLLATVIYGMMLIVVPLCALLLLCICFVIVEEVLHKIYIHKLSSV